MRRFRINTLVVLVLFLGAALAALREATEIWDASVLTFTVGLLLVSILLASYRTGSRRAFWTGFALFGCGYLGLSFVPSIESRLITTESGTRSWR
jgi:hypothetical protein